MLLCTGILNKTVKIKNCKLKYLAATTQNASPWQDMLLCQNASQHTEQSHDRRRVCWATLWGRASPWQSAADSLWLSSQANGYTSSTKADDTDHDFKGDGHQAAPGN